MDFDDIRKEYAKNDNMKELAEECVRFLYEDVPATVGDLDDVEIEMLRKIVEEWKEEHEYS